MFKKPNLIATIALLIVVFVMVVFLNIKIQENNTSAKQEATKISKLNVAVVNEDKPVTNHDKEYNLGASYIKNIERDDSQNWSIVSRGTAESGLNTGKYQLMVTIPSDFSAKVLDINNTNVDKVNVTYKVNSNGNFQIENEANKVGKNIVADLNKQLVDLYVASILANLYTAQQNVQALADTQTTNIGNYRASLYQPAVNFKSYFPNLVAQTTSTVSSNDNLIKSLNGTIDQYTRFAGQQNEYKTDFEQLVAQRSEEQVNYEDFIASLMTMNNNVLSDATQTLFQSLKSTQELLSKQIGTGDEDDKDSYSKLNKDLIKQIDTVKASLISERNKLEEQKESVKTFVHSQLTAYFGKDKDITVKDLFAKDEKTAGNYQSAYHTYVSKGKEKVQQVVNKLPNLSPAHILSKLNAIEPTASNRLTYDVGDFAASEFGQQFKPSNLETELDAALAELNKQKSVAETVEMNTDLTEKKVNVAVSTPDTVQVESIVINGTTYMGASVVAPIKKSKNTFIVNYKHTNPVSSTETITNQAITLTVDGQTAATVKTNEEAYRKAVAAYSTKVQEIIDAYNYAGELINSYYPKDANGVRTNLIASVDGIFNQNLSNVLIDLLSRSITQNLNNLSSNMTTSALDARVKELEALKEPLSVQLAAIKETNQRVTDQISQQLTYVEELKSQLSAVITKQSQYSKTLSQTDSNIAKLNTQLQSLMASTADVQSTASHNSEEAKTVNQIFGSFSDEVKQAQANGEKLSNDAEHVMSSFEKELTDSGAFTTAFAKVLKNAHTNGVPNEAFLDFLSKPVVERASSMKATEKVYQPFTWILLLEVITLFTAYIFATQKIAQKTKDKFKIDDMFTKDLFNVGSLTGLSLVIGLSLGIISSGQLAVEKEYMPAWILLMIFFSLALVQGQYLVMKLDKVVGMGLSLFMLISFVYLSNAIGTTVVLKGLPAIIKRLNFLSFIENSISGYFTGRPAGFILFIVLLLIVFMLMIVNLVVRKSSPIVEETV